MKRNRKWLVPRFENKITILIPVEDSIVLPSPSSRVTSTSVMMIDLWQKFGLVQSFVNSLKVHVKKPNVPVAAFFLGMSRRITPRMKQVFDVLIDALVFMFPNDYD